MAGIIDPDLDTGRKVVQDAVAAFKAQPTIPSAIGAATREIVTGPVSYGMEKIANMARPLTYAGGEFVRGVTGGQPTPRPAAPRPAAPRQPTTVASAPPPNPATQPAPTQAPPPGVSVTPVRSQVNPAAYAPTKYSTTPSLEPITVDPNSAILAQLNNGTWSGMMNARTMARRLDADRTAAVAAANADSSRIGSLAAMSNAQSVARRTAQDEKLTGARLAESEQRLRAGAIDLTDREETDNLRRLAAQGDQKALARYRQIMAAKQGKDPDAGTSEKLLDAYIRSTAEFSKDPANMGKPAPTFQEFLGGLPRGMFPSVERHVNGPPLPEGAVKQVGTSNGRPVYQMRDGSQMVSTIGVRG